MWKVSLVARTSRGQGAVWRTEGSLSLSYSAVIMWPRGVHRIVPDSLMRLMLHRPWRYTRGILHISNQGLFSRLHLHTSQSAPDWQQWSLLRFLLVEPCAYYSRDGTRRISVLIIHCLILLHSIVCDFPKPMTTHGWRAVVGVSKVIPCWRMIGHTSGHRKHINLSACFKNICNSLSWFSSLDRSSLLHPGRHHHPDLSFCTLYPVWTPC